ncbi:hypothetical protein TNCV_5074241 [Trichonephila clavipes]|nr:hypothetical protein TNCV_5074241 [Trichonephila clavipes]
MRRDLRRRFRELTTLSDCPWTRQKKFLRWRDRKKSNDVRSGDRGDERQDPTSNLAAESVPHQANGVQEYRNANRHVSLCIHYHLLYFACKL